MIRKLSLFVLIIFFNLSFCYDFCQYENATAWYFRHCTVNDTEGFPTAMTFLRVNTGWYPLMNNSIQEFSSIASNNGTNLYCTLGGFRNSECESQFYSQTPTLKYNGTPYFCGRVNVSTNISCSSVYNCYCDFVSLVYSRKVFTEEGWENVLFDALISEILALPEVEAQYNLLYNPFRGDKKRSTGLFEEIEENSEEVHVKLLGHSLIFKFSYVTDSEGEKVDHQIALRKDTFHDMISTNNSTFEYTLDDALFVKSGYIYYDIASEGGIVAFGEVWIQNELKCPISDTPFSWSAVENFNCLPLWMKIPFVIVWCLLALGALWLITFICRSAAVEWVKWVFEKIGALIKFCWNFRRSKLAKKLRDKTSNVTNVIINNLTPENDVEMNKPLTKTENKSVKPKVKTPAESNMSLVDTLKAKQRAEEQKSIIVDAGNGTIVTGGRYSRMRLCILLCAIVINAEVSECCTSGIVAPITYLSCTKLNTTYETCNTMFTLKASLPYVQSQTCFALTDTKGAVFTARLIYENFIEKVPLVFKYMTADWYPKSTSIKSCPWSNSLFPVDYCDSYCCDKECDNTNKLNDKTLNHQVTNINILNYPGDALCRRKSEGLFVGCQSLEDSCIYSAYSIIPRGDVLWVYKQSTHEYKPSLTFDLWNGLNYSSTLVTMDNMIKTVDNKFKVTILGTLNVAPTIFPYPDIVNIPNKAWKLADSSSEGAPEARKIGDIQSSSSPALTNPTRNSFIHSKEIADSIEQSDTTIYKFTEAGFNKLNSYPDLPGIFSRNIWSVNEGYLQSYRQDGPSLEIYIESVGNFSFVRKLERVCPESTLNQTSGCYSCDIGSSVIINARSTCLPGVVRVTTDSPYITLATVYLNLKTDIDFYPINFYTSKRVNDFKIKLTSFEDSSEVSVQFTAVDPESALVKQFNDTILDEGNSKGNGTEKEKSIWDQFVNFFTEEIPNFFTETLPDFFSSIFDGTADWWKYLIFIPIVIFALLALALIGYWFVKKFIFRNAEVKPKNN